MEYKTVNLDSTDSQVTPPSPIVPQGATDENDTPVAFFGPPETVDVYSDNPALRMAYGSPSMTVSIANESFRLQRGQPFYRAGKLVKVRPQFRALKIITQDSGSSLSTSFNTTTTQVNIQQPKVPK